MAGKKPSVISGREFMILKMLWEEGSLTVREVRSRLAKDSADEIPYTTVLTLLQLMEKKGYLRHKAEGKTYRYSTRVKQPSTTRLVIRDFMNRFFDGSAEALAMGLADSTGVNPDLLEKLQEEIRKAGEKNND